MVFRRSFGQLVAVSRRLTKIQNGRNLGVPGEKEAGNAGEQPAER